VSPPRPVRLAELVAALSLGIDLGFGQPMEHVLRQCVIALRLADDQGLAGPERAATYYASLLSTVGCHSDAHEQAKWFGDDIALKSRKYDQAPFNKSVLGAVSGLRRIGEGHTPLHRFRLGLEFVLSGHREVEDMINQHALLAYRLAEKLSLAEAARDALVASYESWNGKGWPGRLAGERIPIAGRIARMAEYVEVANRIGGVKAVRRLLKQARGAAFDPALCDRLSERAEDLLKDLDRVAVWDAVVNAEPALADALTGEQLDAALLAIADFVDLKSP
jgi:hypothetical protein